MLGHVLTHGRAARQLASFSFVLIPLLHNSSPQDKPSVLAKTCGTASHLHSPHAPRSEAEANPWNWSEGEKQQWSGSLMGYGSVSSA